MGRNRANPPRWVGFLVWALLWAGAIAAGWFFSDYWRNLLVNAYEARRQQFENLQNPYDYSATPPKLQRQIDEASNLPATDE